MKLSAQLPVPAAAQANKKAIELLRAWVVNNGLQCSIRIGDGQDEPALWESSLATLHDTWRTP